MSTPITEQVNPMLPTTMGALLAEEWTIDPQSTLPSFLEMMMMEEARRSGYEAMKACFLHVEDSLSAVAAGGSAAITPVPTSRSEPIGIIGRTQPRSFATLWLEFKKETSRFIVDQVLKPWGPELRLFLIYMVERGSLISNAATLSESLYGGRRMKLSPYQSQQRKLLAMPKRDGIRLAFLVALGPYLAERIDFMYKNVGRQVDGRSFPSLSSSSLKIKKIFKIIYPFLHLSVQGARLLEQWNFLLGRSVFFDPYSRYLNLVVRRITQQDRETPPTSSHAKKNSSNIPNIFENNLDKSRSLFFANSFNLAKKLAFMTSSALVIGWMARIRAERQELQRQGRNNDGQRLGDEQGQQRNGASSALAESSFPPPPIPLATKDVDLANLPATICPLCRQPRVNPTASTGGYVFCLKCIIAHVKEKESCPITGRYCPESELLRLFESQSR